MRTDNAADIRLDAMLENCIFYIFRMYEFSHSLGQKPTNHLRPKSTFVRFRGVAGLVGIECGVVSGVINLESSGVEAPDWRPRHDEHYHDCLLYTSDAADE